MNLRFPCCRIHQHSDDRGADGAVGEMYHYSATYEFSCCIGCVRGTRVGG